MLDVRCCCSCDAHAYPADTELTGRMTALKMVVTKGLLIERGNGTVQNQSDAKQLQRDIKITRDVPGD